VPLEVILLFDTSGSVRQAGLLDPRMFKEALLDSLGHASLALYTFSRELRLYTSPTRDLERLKQAFSRIEDPKAAVETVKLEDSRSPNPDSETFLYEAIMETARRASRSGANATRILVVVSDGFPTTLTRSQEAADVARECGIPVYPVVLGHWRLVELAELGQIATLGSRDAPKPRAQQRLAGTQKQEATILEFADLGEKTGGRSFHPRDLNSLVARQILQIMAGHIQAEYVAGYYPAPAATPAKPRKIEVKLRSSALGKVSGGMRTLSSR
jgi:VWFA-related protein